MNYIISKILQLNGYEKATVETNYGKYSDYGNNAKTFFISNLFDGVIDHGNHYHTNNYILTKLCLIHFHTRNLDQIKKKVYNNITGLGYNPFNLNELNQMLRVNPSCEGYQHVTKQIEILENRFTINVEERNETDIDLTIFNNYMKSLL